MPRISRTKLDAGPPNRHKAPLPPERVAEVGFVYEPREGRLIAPWGKGPLTWGREQDLLTCLALIDQLRPDCAVWLWPDASRPPVPIEAADPRSWIKRWAVDRASYVASRRAA